MLKNTKQKVTFIDLFAGIGGFHIAFHNCGAECVFVSEWDKSARETYKANFKTISPNVFKEESRLFAGDIKGFRETRGTLFFDVARIIKEKQPKAFFLENVRGLLTHDNGKTFATIQKVLTEDLGYSLFYKVIKASDFGVPQHRPRLFMVGFKDKSISFDFPQPRKLKMTMSDVWGGKVDKEIGYTLRVGGRHSGVGDRRNWDCYMVDGVERCMTPKEGLKMQGFPPNFVFPVSETQAMKQLGNSVAVPAIQAVAEKIIERLE